MFIYYHKLQKIFSLYHLKKAKIREQNIFFFFFALKLF